MAKRECVLFSETENKKKKIYIDNQNCAEILAYVKKSNAHEKRFLYIIKLILEGIRNSDAYDKEDINNRCKDVTAMKFFKGGSNDRIYCKELTTDNGTFVIVAAILHEKKKSQKNSAQEIAQIEKVASYEYDL